MDIYGAVLCAGYGTRMRPLTEVVPKPLLPFLNTPIITYGLHLLSEAGINRVALNLHHLADTIPPVVDLLAPHFGVHPVYSREWEVLGTAGGIAGMWQALGRPSGTLVVLNGDSVTDVELAPLVERHRASGATVSLVVREKTDGQPGRVFLGQDGRLNGIRGFRRPNQSMQTEVEFTGIHLLESSALERLEVEPGDIVDELYGPMVSADEPIMALSADGFWAALDTPRLLFDTSVRVMNDPTCFRLAPLSEETSKLWFHGAQGIADSATFSAPVFVGMNVEIGEGAKIGPNVVLDGVRVAAGTRIENAIIYGAGTIEGEWRNVMTVAGRTATIPD